MMMDFKWCNKNWKFQFIPCHEFWSEFSLLLGMRIWLSHALSAWEVEKDCPLCPDISWITLHWLSWSDGIVINVRKGYSTLKIYSNDTHGKACSKNNHFIRFILVFINKSATLNYVNLEYSQLSIASWVQSPV